MANPKPVGPYQSLREAICAEIDAGYPLREVGARLNALLGRAASDRRVLNYASSIMHRGDRARPVAISLTIAPEVFNRLLGHAAAREIRAADLVHRLIEAAVDDDLFTAILDDRAQS